MSHTGSNGSSVSDRVNRVGNIEGSRGVGENVAMGQRTPEAVVSAWMNSEGHRANILRSETTHIGIGFVGTRNQDGTYSNGRWTQKFTRIA